MVVTHIRQIQGDKTYVYIPSFLRKEFGLTKDTPVDISMQDGKIVVTPLGGSK